MHPVHVLVDFVVSDFRRTRGPNPRSDEFSIRAQHLVRLLPWTTVIFVGEWAIEVLPAPVRIQVEESIASDTIAPDELAYTVLNSLHDHPGFRLGLLPLTRKLNFMEIDEATTGVSGSMKGIEGVFELCESKLFLVVDKTR